MMRRLLLALPLILLAWPAFAACNPATSTCVGVVNIRSPAYGAVGNGSHDDTAAIQSAIDYAAVNGNNAVYCPVGTYKTSSTIFLDPPANERATVWTGTGYFTSGVLTVVSTITGTITPIVNSSPQSTGDYIFATGTATNANLTGTSGPTIIISGTSPTFTVNNNTLTLGSSGSPVNLSAFNPAVSSAGFSYQMSFVGDPSNNAYFPGCKLNFTFNNAPAFLVGQGQGMRVAEISVNGPTGGYRCNQSPYGVGIGLSGGGGGSHVNLVENTSVGNFYNLWATDSNDPVYNNLALNDSNTWKQPNGYNGCYGINILGTQAYINDIVDPVISSTAIGVASNLSKQAQIRGGNISATSGASNSYTMTGVTTPGCGATYLCLSATIATGDTYIGSVYNAYTVLTQHYGLIPFTLTSYNATTGVIVLQATNPWLYTNYGVFSYWINNNIHGEVVAATTLYAAERAYTTEGQGIDLDGTHVENPTACTALYVSNAGWSGQTSNSIKNPFFDWDITRPSGSGGFPANLATPYCQLAFPFVSNTLGPLALSGGSWGAPASASQPILMDIDAPTSGKQLMANFTAYPRFNTRITDFGLFGLIGQYNGSGSGLLEPYIGTVARGSGIWDADYFLPQALADWDYTPTGGLQMNAGELMSSYCGDEPCPSATPNLSTTLFGEVSGGGAVTGTIDNGSGTGTPTGQILTVSADTSTVLGSGNVLTGTSVPAGEKIINQISGPTGGIGGTSTWNVAVTGAVTSTSITAAMGALGTYPPINCRTVYKSVDWNTPAVTAPSTVGGGIFKRSASCPNYSYGQNLTQATVGATDNADGTGYIDNGTATVAGYILHWTDTSGGTKLLNPGDQLVSGGSILAGTDVIQQQSGSAGLSGNYLVASSATQTAGSSGSPLTIASPSVTWIYDRGSSDLYLDAQTMQWMFPGLGISINNGSGAQPYVVTGVYPLLGYVSVIWAAYPAGGTGVDVGLQGAAQQNYSCASSCTIAEAPFAWTAY